MESQAPFNHAELESICKVLGHTETGLKGSEIELLLRQIQVEDISPDMTKWKRLFNALATRQNKDQRGNKVLSFINAALSPARYVGECNVFENRRVAVNVILAFSGLEYGEDGKYYRKKPVTTLRDAERRAEDLRVNLSDRQVHPEVLFYCSAELLEDNYFHAVLEATKSIAERIRQKTGLKSDGVELVKGALGGQSPLLRINPLTTKSHESEQRGFVSLLIGVFGVFRNPTAHAPRKIWQMSEEDALDLLTMASYIHRRLDSAV